MIRKKRVGMRSAGVISAVVGVMGVGVLWHEGVSKATMESPKQQISSVRNTSEHTNNKSNSAKFGNQQPTFNGQKITANDWHPVGPFYYAKGTVSKVQVSAVPPEVKGPVWTEVFVTINQYVNSSEPQTQDGSLKVGSTSPIVFYDYVDKGQSHLKMGDQVMIKFAEYTTPAGTIVWGSKYDDIYYKKNNGFVNNKGEVIS